MKKKLFLFIGLIIILILFTNSVNKKIYYVSFELPGNLKGMTIPPLGIFIEEQYKINSNKPGSVLRHELVHWEQYKKMGLIGFYFNYFSGYLKTGSRFNHPMEEEARKLSFKNN
jgi:hypothetical protein